MKSKYILQFPTKQSEHEYLINPMHLGPAVCLAMGEEEAPVCLACDEEKRTHMVVTFEPDKKFKFFYPDDTECTSIYLVMNQGIICWLDDMDAEEDLDAICREFGANESQLLRKDFYTRKEADAYVCAVDELMYAFDHEDEYRFIDKDMYYKIKEAIQRVNV